jgi:hypothetical protein
MSAKQRYSTRDYCNIRTCALFWLHSPPGSCKSGANVDRWHQLGRHLARGLFVPDPLAVHTTIHSSFGYPLVLSARQES